MILNGTDFGRASVTISILKARCDRLRRRIGDSRQAAAAQAEILVVEKRIEELETQIRSYNDLFGNANLPEVLTLMDVPNNLIQRRIRLGLTQSDLGAACGQTRQCISRYERTRYNGASLARLIQIDSLLRAEELSRQQPESRQMTIAL